MIGDRRWDRLPGGDWLRVAAGAADAAVGLLDGGARATRTSSRDDEITFYDPTFPAWFRLRFDPATGHVDAPEDGRDARTSCEHDYSGFDRPAVDLAAALAVALRLALDELEEARRVLERGEAGRRVARAARRAAQAARAAIVPAVPTRPPSTKERSRARFPEESRRVVAVHASILRCGSRRSATCSWT